MFYLIAMLPSFLLWLRLDRPITHTLTMLAINGGQALCGQNNVNLNGTYEN